MATATSTVQVCRNFIQGRWVESSSSRTSERRNPANLDEVIGLAPLSTREETRQAVAAALAAFPKWRDTPAPVRGRVISKAALLMEEQKDDLALLMTREEGKALKDALGEVQKSINILEFMAGESRRIGGETVPSELPKNFAYTLKQPLGVVGAITPWNFPISIPVWKIAPALVAGNTVVFKPATLTPFTGAKVVEIFERAGVPAGVLNMVAGSGGEVGDELLQHPDVRAVSFTGSTEVGSELYAQGARRMKKCQCEMGGKNPLVILADADLPLAVESAVFGAFASTGQRCTATSRVVIEEAVADRFVEMLVERARKLRVGNGLEPGIDVGPAVDEAQMKTDLRYIEIGKKEGKLLLGGGRLSGGAYDRGYFVAPTIFDHVASGSSIAQDEIFGPVLSVIRVKNFEEALRVANSVRYGLSSSLYTNDAAKIFEFIDRIETGITHVNSPTVGGEAQLPFGGMKGTGVGLREMGRVAIDFYTELKTVYIDYTGGKRDSNIY
ncbi:MAG TPA: aldehyde dehydrogenase family protein [Candidatus Limnocylindria bacterium]|nr:aldehyde dehydrogenase family protein [Candidatus Limnocylindria bacterium]